MRALGLALAQAVAAKATDRASGTRSFLSQARMLHNPFYFAPDAASERMLEQHRAEYERAKAVQACCEDTVAEIAKRFAPTIQAAE